MPTLDNTGLILETFVELRDSIEQELRDATERQQLDAHSATSWIGNLNNAFTGRLTQSLELLQAVLDARDPARAGESALLGLGRVIGSAPRAARFGRVVLLVDVDADVTIAPGALIINPEGASANTWSNPSTLELVAGPGQPVYLTSQVAGAGARLVPGAALEINSGPPEVTAVSWPTSADPGYGAYSDGQAAETVTAWRQRWERTRRTNSSRVARILDSLLQHPVVWIDRAQIYEPDPCTAEIVIQTAGWQSEAEIAQAMLEVKPLGVSLVGRAQVTTTVQSVTRVAAWTYAGAAQQYLGLKLNGRAPLAAVQRIVDDFVAGLNIGEAVQPTPLIQQINALAGVNYITAFEWRAAAFGSAPTTFVPVPYNPGAYSYPSITVSLW